MANTPTTTQQPPLTVETFYEDRKAFWANFTHGTTLAVVGLIVLLLILWIFVV